MEIQSKFSIGETVYYATTTRVARKVDCPDCLGQKQWKAISPAGDEFTFSCPRCANSYDSDLEYHVFNPSVHQLTIGSIRADTANKKNPVQYMCVETGIGSIYNEGLLFFTEEQAFEAASVKAQLETAEDPNMIKRYNKTVSLSLYQLSGRQNLDKFAKANFCPSPVQQKAWETLKKIISKEPKAPAEQNAFSTLNKVFTRGLSASSSE